MGELARQGLLRSLFEVTLSSHEPDLEYNSAAALTSDPKDHSLVMLFIVEASRPGLANRDIMRATYVSHHMSFYIFQRSH